MSEEKMIINIKGDHNDSNLLLNSSGSYTINNINIMSINNTNINNNMEIFKNFDTNIDNYNYYELLNILELNNPSKKEIENKINDLITNYFYDNFNIQHFFYF